MNEADDMKNVKRDSVLILSGGMDSVTLLYHRKDRIALAVSFDYGSKHNKREIECASYHCQILGIEHIVIPLAFMGKYFESSLLLGGTDIPKADYAEENMKSTVVPFRNGIMLSIACGIAESRNMTKVMMANHSGDHSIYPDCRPHFVASMGEAMKAGTYEGVTLDAEFTDISKSEIALIGKELGIDYSKTYSCYNGREKHCGECATCRERKEALRAAGIEDKTEYEK